jgi:hypothetical protein
MRFELPEGTVGPRYYLGPRNGWPTHPFYLYLSAKNVSKKCRYNPNLKTKLEVTLLKNVGSSVSTLPY